MTQEILDPMSKRRTSRRDSNEYNQLHRTIQNKCRKEIAVLFVIVISNLCLTHRNSFRYGLKSFRYKGAKLWNDLPVEIRNSPSKYSFKINLETFLQNNKVINDGFLNLVYK